MTVEVINTYEEANILITNVPANMTKYYQPLDLTVNGHAEQFLKSKFTEWCSSRVRAYLDNGVSINNIEVGSQLSKIKPIHAGWLVQFYNDMTTSKGKEIIDSGVSAPKVPLVDFIHILTDFYHLPVSLVLFTHSLIDACEFAQIGLNHAMN